MLHLTIWKRSHQKIWNNLKIMSKSLRPCQTKLTEGIQFCDFPGWHMLVQFKISRDLPGILEWSFLRVVTRTITKMMHYHMLTELHSSSKEMQLFSSLEDFSFTILLRQHVLKHFKIVREPCLLLECGFWQVITMSIVELIHNPRVTGIQSSPKEMQPYGCCVSFGKDCKTLH